MVYLVQAGRTSTQLAPEFDCNARSMWTRRSREQLPIAVSLPARTSNPTRIGKLDPLDPNASVPAVTYESSFPHGRLGDESESPGARRTTPSPHRRLAGLRMRSETTRSSPGLEDGRADSNGGTNAWQVESRRQCPTHNKKAAEAAFRKQSRCQSSSSRPLP